MIVYYKLWCYLDYLGYNRTYLLRAISTPTLAKLGKNETVTTETIGKICELLNCQPEDIMSNIKVD